MTLYGKGITVASGFDLSGAPVDHKYVADTTAEMTAYAEAGAAYEGMQVYNKEDKTIYVYNGTSFQTMSASSGSAEIDLSNYVTLDSAQTITGKKTFTDDVTVKSVGFGGGGSVTSAEYSGNAATATKLKTGQDINITGDVSGSASFDGSTAASITATLSNSGVTAGTYPKVTVDAKGRVTKGASLTASDIPNLTLAKITDAGTAASKAVGTAEGNVPVLVSGGKLDPSVLPALAVKETFVASSQAAMLALTAQEGDICIRTDVSKTYVLQGNDPKVLSNWIALAAPTDNGYVASVNGKSGAVTLTTSDVAEGSNQYYTDARATANFNTNVAKTSVTSMRDGSHVILDTDEIYIDCGNA